MLLFTTWIEIGGKESRKRQQAQKGDGGWEKHKCVRECGRKRQKVNGAFDDLRKTPSGIQHTHGHVLAVTTSQDPVFASQKHNERNWLAVATSTATTLSRCETLF